MSIEQRANIKFCFKLGKTFSETFQLMQQDFGDDCLSHGRVHEWYTSIKNGREDINDDLHVGQPKFVITPESIGKVSDFLKIWLKSSLRFMEMELGMSKDSIHRILTPLHIHIHLYIFILYISRNDKYHKVKKVI